VSRSICARSITRLSYGQGAPFDMAFADDARQPRLPGHQRDVRRSPTAMKSGPCGSMPTPQIAKPAKPAPSVSTVSRCASGTDLALATPWMSTNWAST
jgi:hypothetical protein